MVQIIDAHGQEITITHKHWRETFLPVRLRQVWSRPDALYTMIAQGIEEGYPADVLRAAEVLVRTDPNPERGHLTLAKVHLAMQRPNLAHRVLRAYAARFGESAPVFILLARVHADRGNHQAAADFLLNAIKLQPNSASALRDFVEHHRSRGSEQMLQETLTELAELPGSWRPHLALAQTALAKKDLPAALTHHRLAIGRAPKPLPEDLLELIAADLSAASHHAEVLKLIGPSFRAEIHGLAVGSHLIEAHIACGTLNEAARLIAIHRMFERPDWLATLARLETKLAQARGTAATA